MHNSTTDITENIHQELAQMEAESIRVSENRKIEQKRYIVTTSRYEYANDDRELLDKVNSALKLENKMFVNNPQLVNIQEAPKDRAAIRNVSFK